MNRAFYDICTGKRLSVVLILLCAPCLVFATGSAAAERATAIAWKAPGNLVIDGDLSEWNRSAPIVLNDASQLIRDADFWGGPDDLSAKVYVMWDEENLYIGAEVVEDTPFGAIAMLPIDDNDNFAIYISTNPNADPNRTAYESTDFRLILVTDDLNWDTAFDRSAVSDLKGFWSIGMEGSSDVLKGYERAATPTETGYILEMKIPWINFSNENIPVFVPEEGQRIGFNIVITDIAYPCPGTEFIPQIAWTGDASLTTNPSVWGFLEFRSESMK